MTVPEQLSKNPKLRRKNRAKSIHSSLAIEQNSLSIDQVGDVIDGNVALNNVRINIVNISVSGSYCKLS